MLPSRTVTCSSCQAFLWEGAVYCFGCWRNVWYRNADLKLTEVDPRAGLGDVVSKLARAAAKQRAGPDLVSSTANDPMG